MTGGSFVVRYTRGLVMPKGKRGRKACDDYPIIPYKPLVCLLGHSFPRRLQDYFDGEMLKDGIGLDITMGNKSVEEGYAEYLKFSEILRGVSFVHCAEVLGSQFFGAVTQVGEMNADIVIAQMGTNDLAAKHVSPESVAMAYLSMINYLCDNFPVNCVILVTELKREDEKDVKEAGKGRLLCSKAEFRKRVMKFNELLKEGARARVELFCEDLPGFWWDGKHQEIDIAAWTSDDLHPGPDTDSYGFRKYIKEIRNMINFSVPRLASVLQFKGLC